MSSNKKQQATRKIIGKRKATAWDSFSPLPMSLLCVVALLLGSPTGVRGMSVALTLLLLVSAALCFQTLRDRISLPLVILFLYILMCGVSTAYALSGKFALTEFLKFYDAFCIVLILLAWAPDTEDGQSAGRWVASVLACTAAWVGLISVDMISTHWVSDLFFRLIGAAAQDYSGISGVEEGVRLKGVFNVPNVFAGAVGIGVLLSLSLVLTAERRWEKNGLLAVLFVNALAFVLAFSMGGSGMIFLAFLLLLLLERKERRARLLVLMAETLVLTVAAAALCAGALREWTQPRPIPLLCLVLGAALLCVSDAVLGRRVAGFVEKLNRRLLWAAAGLAGALAAFAILAYNLTGGIALEKDVKLLRTVYPEPGTYTLSVESEGELSVTIRSKSRVECMMRGFTPLYEGEADGARFTVPEDSIVTYIYFYSEDGTYVRSAVYQGETAKGKVPLGYKLLPGFIANRLQGLFASQNAIQRRVFSADGLKLFARSPVFGLGIGAYESALCSVQSFYYETKYAHNHYVQTLAETGMIGLLLFAGILLSAAFSLVLAFRDEKRHPLCPALAAATLFMAGHAAIELVFSGYCYLPEAYGVFALTGLCCSETEPRLRLPRRVKNTALAAMLLSACVFCGFLLGNIAARKLVNREPTMESLEKAAEMDKFEWADYAFSYLVSVENAETTDETREKADRYAARLEKLQSNTVPFMLAEYYLLRGDEEKAFEMTEKYVDYMAADPSAWNKAFDLLGRHLTANNLDAVQREAVRLLEKMETWNAGSLKPVTLDEGISDFVDRLVSYGRD